MDPEEEIRVLDDIADQIISSLKLIVESGEQLPDRLMFEIAEILQDITQRTLELQQQISPVEGLPSEPPKLDVGPFASSQINSFKYDPQKQQLFVKFMGKDSADTGPVYGYQGVPPFIYDVFRRGAVGPKTTGKNKYHAWQKGVTPSLGAAMNALIKSGQYQYQRLT